MPPRCEACGGSGEVDAWDPAYGHWTEECRKCDGIGYVTDDGKPAYEFDERTRVK